MPKNSLGPAAVQEIRSALAGFKGKELRAEVARLAAHFTVSASRIYEVTRDVRPRRKTRADRGRRRADIIAHDGLRHAAELVCLHKVDPDLAIETVELNGGEVPVSQATFVRYLRERGLSKKQRRLNVRPYRPFQAKAPGELYQFDISGVKERWLDLKTRRVLHVSPLEVSKNHPNQKPGRIPVWKFTLLDDNSRYTYVEFIACTKPNSLHSIQFLLNAFREMGVPLTLYSDNDSIIVSRSMQRAASILDRAFASSGGFKLEQHLPGNPQATGKVERAHQKVEKFEKLFGIGDSPPSIDEINRVARGLCVRYNEKPHRATGDIPALRFRSTFAVMRVPPPALLDSAFKAREFECVIRPDLTVSFNGVRAQLPRSAEFPFRNWHGERVTVVHPPDADYFVLLGLDGNEYEIALIEARADEAGSFKSVAESTPEQLMEELKKSDRARKAARKAAGAKLLRPLIDTDERADHLPAIMPRKVDELSAERLAEIAPGAVAPSLGAGRLLTEVEAVELLQAEEHFTTPVTAADRAWLKCIFRGRERAAEAEILAEAEARPSSVTVMQRRA